MKTVSFARDDRLYIVGPIAPYQPRVDELDAYAYAEDVRKVAPSEHILWLHGQYVEAERPNANGHMWTQDELCIASLTPRYMPITVMHDPRTAVGLIADAKLLTPAVDNVPLARIDTKLALWQHRFPDVAEEALANYEAGTLMQSMECLPSHYDCVDCGRRFPWMGMSYEDPNWCEHFQASATAATRDSIRRLGNVTFTGSGLIFGTRGARGAMKTAQLDVLAAEVVEFHQKAKQDTAKKQKPRRSGHMEISDERYAELVAAEQESKRLTARVPDLEAQAAKVPDLEQKIVNTEAETAREKKGREDAEAKVADAEAKEREAVLTTERFDKLGTGFKDKLGEFTKAKLTKVAATASDDEWEGELVVVEEATGVKRDDGTAANGDANGATGDANGATFDKDAVASTRLGGGSGNGNGNAAPSRQAVGSVVRGLMPKKPTK